MPLDTFQYVHVMRTALSNKLLHKGGDIMRKRLLICLFACMMVLSFAVPVMAAEVAPATETAYEEDGQAFVPFNELTRLYFRVTLAGRLQIRVWSITNGRWITDWEYVV